MNSSRIRCFDFIKGISILLVVFCHYVVLSKETIVGNVFMTLAWAAVPCFMMTSGALLHQKKYFLWRPYLYKLLKIYLVFSVWRGIYFLIYRVVLQLEVQLSFTKILEYLFLFRDIEGVNTDVMWYIRAYFVVMLLYPITHSLLIKLETEGSFTLMFAALISSISGIIIPSLNWTFGKISQHVEIMNFSFDGFNLVMPFTNYGGMIFYFIVGAIVYKNKDRLLINCNTVLLIITAVLSTIGLLLVKYLDTGLLVWGGIYLPGGYSHLMVASLSISLWMLLVRYGDCLGERVDFFTRNIGKNTMGIYYLHYILLAVLGNKIYPKITEHYSFGLNCLKTILIASVCAALTFVFRKIPLIGELVK